MSNKPLVIVESPTKVKTIQQYLGKNYDVISCVGHVKDLPTNELGIDVENNFEIKLTIHPDKKKFISLKCFIITIQNFMLIILKKKWETKKTKPN